MTMKKIIVTIDKRGAVKFEAKGFEGRECLRATENFEKLLGGRILEQQMKRPEEMEKEKLSLGN